MTDTVRVDPLDRAPDIVEDESGEQWYVLRHVPDGIALAMLALYLREDCGSSRDEVYETLTDTSVSREWWRDAPKPENDEWMEPCAADAEDAIALTVLRWPAPPVSTEEGR